MVRFLLKKKNKGRTFLSTVNGTFPCLLNEEPHSFVCVKELWSWLAMQATVDWPKGEPLTQDTSLEVWIWYKEKGVFLQQVDTEHR